MKQFVVGGSGFPIPKVSVCLAHPPQERGQNMEGQVQLVT